ncbi:sigma-70 family RNA polymerase sigma factor [Streptomyces sp. NBRC 109706]|uniref:sigma-70 family RNA polymerase sigma factor n=1 Tax=Streptomyces sp. NBRC 109706 TaxID=1550035 RepID=UPI00078093C2|nr:sigma-70 family RNA polymerase sigma factor [Streptomyces sp. NBRC 109706]
MRRVEPTTEKLVVAAQRGAPDALRELLGAHLPLTYAIVGRSLGRSADVDDVVQETMLRVVRDLPGLREPGRFRAWLATIAMHQVNDRRRIWRRATERTMPLDETTDELPDPDGDFTGVTLLRLELSGQRRQTVEATRWLDPEHRDLLALWWLETAGELTRAELAEALGVSVAHAAVRVQRMREQLEQARALVAALDRAPRCAALDASLATWDGVPGSVWRKRLGRHVRTCDACSAGTRGLVPAARLLAGIALVPVPASLIASLALDGLAPATAAAGGSALAGGGATGPGHLLPGVAAKSLAGFSATVVAAVAVVTLVPWQPVSTRSSDEASPPPPTPVPSEVVPGSGSAGTSVDAPPSGTVEPDPVPPVESGVVPFRGVANSECGDMERMGVSWFYNWGLDPGGCGDRGFVPMISGKSHRSPEAVRGAVDQVVAAGYDTVLGFNEPNKADQADLSVAEAVALWPALTSNENVLVGSPATSADSGGRQWFSDFMAEVEAGNLRVDFVNVHWYGWNADSCDARAAEFERYLDWVGSKAGGRPVWVTEYGCMHQSNPDEATVIDFYTASLEVFAERPWITRYAWYPWNPHNHLVADDGSLTALGTTYTRQPTHR